MIDVDLVNQIEVDAEIQQPKVHVVVLVKVLEVVEEIPHLLLPHPHQKRYVSYSYPFKYLNFCVI